MEFAFGSKDSAASAARVLKTQIEQVADKTITVRSDGSRVIISLPELPPRKKKVVEYTATRLAALMRNLEDL